MIKIKKQEWNTIMANLYYYETQLEKIKHEKEQTDLLLQTCIDENVKLKKFKDKVIFLLNSTEVKK